VCVLLCSSFLLGVLWENAFDGVPSFPSGVWSTEDKIVLGIISRMFGLSSCILEHFSLLGAGLGPSTEWVGVAKFLGPTIAPQNLLFGSSDGKEGFDDIGPLSWLVKSCPP